MTNPAELQAVTAALADLLATPVPSAGSTPSAAAAATTTDPESTSPALPNLTVAWRLALDGSADARPASALAAANVSPWLSFVFTTPAPLTSHLDALQRELEEAARLAGGLPPGAVVQVLWEPAAAPPPAGSDAPGAGAFAAVAAADPAASASTADAGQSGAAEAASTKADSASAAVATTAPTWASDYAFLLKRAAAAVGGATPSTRLASAPLAADPALIAVLYAGDLAAYLDILTLQPATPAAITALGQALLDLDPGRPLVIDDTALPAPAERALVTAARNASAGAPLTLFAVAQLQAGDLAPLVVLARTTAGDLSYDSYSLPTSKPGEELTAYTFVRGEDLALRVIVEVPSTQREEAKLVFADAQLARPQRVDLTSGEAQPLGAARATAEGYVIRVGDPGEVLLLAIERPAIGSLEGVEGVAEQVTIASERQIPVEEILRRLQAFEDAQTRKLDTYSGKRTTHLRFSAGGGTTAIEVSYEGAVFFEQGKGFDWAWERFLFNGVRWKGDKIPEIPLVQPEKAAVMPVEITFGKTYTYRLRGTATVNDRSCWVIDFEPIDRATAEAQRLYQGTVWVDREIFARVQTRALQLGLEGEVLSNEETLIYQPLDANGANAPWAATSYVLPTRTTGQQILSILNTATVVEREVLLSDLRLNADGFAEARAAVAASDATMVRDTDEGLRYLVKGDDGTRVVKDGYDTDKWFGLAGTFWDDDDDFPLPLAGINYLSLDFRGTGAQANLFFAGVIAIGNLATPRLFGSSWDAGVDVFVLGISGGDTQYRNGEEVEEEEIETRPASMTLNLGHPLGKFGKLDLDYRLEYRSFSRADDTADTFVLPQSTLTHSVSTGVSFARSGFKLEAVGTYNKRAKWEEWGLPGNNEFDPDHQEYSTWSLQASKSWYFKNFQKFGVEIDYLGGDNLDRFSKIEFGFFGSTRVKGFSSNRVRAEEAWLAHLEYGFEIGSVFRVSASLDGALVSDDASGFDQEPLIGIGLGGTLMGPWQTIVNFDVGTPIEGPDDGIVLYLVFLKLFG